MRLAGYLGKRMVRAVLLLFGVSVLSFALAELAPGSFFDEMRLNPQISPATLAALRQQHGLNDSLPVRYGHWLRSVARGDFGYSFAYNSPVGPLLAVRARNTLLLAVPAMLIAWSLALPLGVWSASHPDAWADRIISSGTSLLVAVPDLLLALGALILAVRTHSFPVGGMEAVGATGVRDVAFHLVLPVLILVLSSLPLLVRHVRASMLEVLGAPFIQAARGHGIRRSDLLFRHALPAAANPLTSLLGFSIATLLSGSLLVEVIMSWPGLGPLLLEAVLGRDLYVVIGAVMLSTLFLVSGMFAADILLYTLDPRIRSRA
ncbi:MAG TPA: ABC transporter permease [Terriglobales bacterium]|jgi:peptide/nickel transport system permease protein|nr:ABC transporter permease [Terriglobales bacterium]